MMNQELDPYFSAWSLEIVKHLVFTLSCLTDVCLMIDQAVSCSM